MSICNKIEVKKKNWSFTTYGVEGLTTENA